MTLNPLLPIMYEPLVRTALLEDLGRAGDITADAIVPADQRPRSSCAPASRASSPGSTSRAAPSRLISPAIEVEVERPDGSAVAPGEIDRDHRRARRAAC